MSWSKSLPQYIDIAAHLDTIVHTNARQCQFATPKEAQLWRSRVYMYRTLLREASEDGRSQFDRLLFRIDKADPRTVHILEGYPDNITFLTADGGPISGVDTAHNIDPEELQQAIAARERLDKRLNSETAPQSLTDLGLD